MIKKLLIANRGEIACRIIKTARKMGIKTVAVYSESDINALHVKLADEAVFIGDSPAPASYLSLKNILNAAKISGANAVHPGYGFLSENAQFAKLLRKYGIIFVGPSVEAIEMMGDKIQAKKVAREAGVNIVPGYIGEINNEEEALSIAEGIGYPIMLKAAAGGGGKGIRVVHNPDQMKQAFQSTKNEALSSFADERIFIEKFIDEPRHIEIQIIADEYGNIVCLGERDCSVQRRHQKVIEEAPSAFIDDEVRNRMYAQSLMLARQVGYCSAGTVEYMVDEDKNFYFLEMNTRLQVEHPVTELVTGYDIVELMIKVASGEKLPITQEDVQIKGWAIESRIYAEDPASGFLPSTGKVYLYKEPEPSKNIRLDSGMYEGGEVSMFYDPMIAKLISYAPTRDEAIEFMKNALDKYVIRGISSNISFLQAILNNEKFKTADISTNFVDREYGGGFAGVEISDESTAVFIASAIFIHISFAKRANEIEGRMRGKSKALSTRWIVILGDKKYSATVRPLEEGFKITVENDKIYIRSKWLLGARLFQAIINDKECSLQLDYSKTGFYLTYLGHTIAASVYTPRAAELLQYMKKPAEDEEESKSLLSNITGMVVSIKISEGDVVAKGQPLIAIEAMKMENVLLAPSDGKVAKILCKEKTSVISGELLIELE